MLEVMELTLEERVLTVLESVLSVVWRPCTLVFMVSSFELSELLPVVRAETAELRDVTDVWREDTDDWIEVKPLLIDAMLLLSDARLVDIPATDLPILVTLVPMPVSAVLTEAVLASPLLTVNCPMFEDAYPEVELDTAAPTRYAPLPAEAGRLTLKA
jgi:hypothetical protein